MLCGVAIGSLLLLRAFAATAPGVLLALAFTVFAVVVFWCQWRASETDAAEPTPARNRGITARPLTGLPSRFAGVVAVLRREHTRDTVRQWLHATTDALGGIPPPDVSPRALEDTASGEDPTPEFPARWLTSPSVVGDVPTRRDSSPVSSSRSS